MTGRCLDCKVTDVYHFVHFDEPSVLISFQIVFPESEPRIPVKIFTELYHLYIKSRRECEALKEAAER